MVKGLISGSSVMAGTLHRTPDRRAAERRHFQHLLDGVMIVSGTALLWRRFARKLCHSRRH